MMKRKLLIGAFALVALLATTILFEISENTAHASYVMCKVNDSTVCDEGGLPGGGYFIMYGHKVDSKYIPD
jgi:hypothetical protein